VLLQVIPNEARNEMKKNSMRKNAHKFLEMVQQHCLEFGQRIKSSSGDDLIALWTDEIRPLWIEIHPLQDKMNEELNLRTRKLKGELIKLLGHKEANMVLTTISSAGELASLGPLMGLFRLRNGEMRREKYLQLYGHRGPQENEIAEPRPVEDPDWLDSQLAEFALSPVDVPALLEKRDAEFAAMRERISEKLSPKQAQNIEKIIDETMETISLREETRSELTRLVGVIRELFLRAGELSGLGEGVFFLTIDEVLEALSGDSSAAENIPQRREMYERYRALPHLPTWIRGRFDPFQWAADPNRRQDVYDLQAPITTSALGDKRIIKGHPGSAGLVEGIVQRIDNPEQGNLLQPGEILVTSTTNVGWTPLFTRAAAVITDIGGSLSHAAIVARELGIPAVVGCGNATSLLHTGDRVRVDGERGTVEIEEMTRAPNPDESAR